VAIRQLVENFGRYPYLPRVRDPEVLLGAIRGGFSLLTWEKDSFVYAETPGTLLTSWNNSAIDGRWRKPNA